MYPLSLAMAVIVPALLLVEYGLIKTRRPLLGEGLWGGFVAGVAVGVAVIAWELAFSWLLPLDNLPPVPAAAGHALLIAALPEEALKYGATLLVVRRFVYPGNVADVILTALGVAVGFAVAEDASYVINASVATGDAGMVALVRSLSAVPVHVVCGLVMGGMIGPALWQQDMNPQSSQWRLAGALLLPVVIHGAYDFLLMLRQGDPDAVWTFQALPLLLALATMFGIGVSNHALRTASDAEHSALPTRAGAAAAIGVFLLLVGLSLVGLTLLARDLLIQQSLAVYCVVPLLFGLDMLWTALTRMGRRQLRAG